MRPVAVMLQRSHRWGDPVLTDLGHRRRSGLPRIPAALFFHLVGLLLIDGGPTLVYVIAKRLNSQIKNNINLEDDMSDDVNVCTLKVKYKPDCTTLPLSLKGVPTGLLLFWRSRNYLFFSWLTKDHIYFFDIKDHIYLFVHTWHIQPFARRNIICM